MTTSASSRSRAIVNRLVSRVRNSVTDFSERGARLTRRDDREYREYLREEQRSQPRRPARKMSANFEPGTLTGNAFVIVLGAELLEERNRSGKRLDALHRSVRHVDRRLAGAVHRFHVGAFRDEILDHRVVAARCCMMQRRVAV